MDFIDQLKGLANRISTVKDIIQTEEATKNAMIMPFIQILGYNVFDPLEVTPELVADIGTKKGEKVDYSILRDGKPIILFECKKSGGDLSINHASQLFRYFHVTAARFAVLTNGIQYRFFTDLEQPNKMDETPFFEFNIFDFKERDVEELKKFAKSSFDVDAVLATANDLKYTRVIQAKLAMWISNPTEDFVRLVSSDLTGSKRFTPQIKEQFTTITKRAFDSLINEKINERLKGAMSPEMPSVPRQQEQKAVESNSDATQANAPSSPTISTSDEEIEGFHTVRSILRGVIPAKRVHMRDAQSYCAILLDDNNRKSICRLRFNNSQKLKLSVFNEKREELTVDIESVEDIFNYSDQIRATVESYLISENK